MGNRRALRRDDQGRNTIDYRLLVLGLHTTYSHARTVVVRYEYRGLSVSNIISQLQSLPVEYLTVEPVCTLYSTGVDLRVHCALFLFIQSLAISHHPDTNINTQRCLFRTLALQQFLKLKGIKRSTQ